MGTPPILNARRVNDTLLTAGLPTADQLRALAADGYEVVINLALDNNPPYSLPGEADLVRSLGLTYIHIPIDFKNPTAQDFDEFCAAMDAHAERKRFVHCALNKRVSAFLGLYLVVKKKQDRDAAFSVMREIWRPDPVWESFIQRMLGKKEAD